MSIEVYNGDGVPPAMDNRPTVDQKDRYRDLNRHLHALLQGSKIALQIDGDEAYYQMCSIAHEGFVRWFDSFDRDDFAMTVEETALAAKNLRGLVNHRRVKFSTELAHEDCQGHEWQMIDHMEEIITIMERFADGAEPAERIITRREINEAEEDDRHIPDPTDGRF